MPKNCSVCPDRGRGFKYKNRVPLHQNYCVKRVPQVPFGDHFCGDRINGPGPGAPDLDLEGYDAFRYGNLKTLSGTEQCQREHS